MHRSGTSVLARVLSRLGYALPTGVDLYRAHDNPGGHWESRTVIAWNDRLLRVAGGAWWAPPDGSSLPWDRLIARYGSRARRSFVTAFPEHPWACKDPRLTLTLPFWEAVWQGPVIRVAALRSPVAVARSVMQRDAYPADLALALWDHYVAALGAWPNGGQLVVVSYERLVSDPTRTVERLASDLEALGASGRSDLRGAVEAIGEPRTDTEMSPEVSIPTEVWKRWERLCDVEGLVPASRDTFWLPSDFTQDVLRRERQQLGVLRLRERLGTVRLGWP